MVLVDFDNIDIVIRKKGLDYVVDCIIAKINPDEVVTKNITIRLYGGWYELSSLTKAAQTLQNAITLNYPKVMILNNNNTKVVVNVVMAYSITAQPSKHLFHTYRSRSVTSGIYAVDPKKFCTNVDCALDTVYNFIKSNTCHKCQSKSMSDLIKKNEQKLVDTMLTTDIIDFANQGADLFIVSSDDDLWPGILSAINKGVFIVHIHTKSRQTNNFYLRTVGSTYKQRSLK